MSEADASRWFVTAHCIVRHPSDAAVLAQTDARGLAFPSFPLSSPNHSVARPVQARLRSLLGGDVFMLRCVGWWRSSTASREVNMLFEIEWLGGPEPPAGWSWIRVEHVNGELLAPPVVVDAVHAWLGEQAGGEVPAQRVLWARPGWFGDAREWIHRCLDVSEEASIEQVKVWSLSCVLRVRTGDDYVYFKAASPHFSAETSITAALYTLFPAAIPRPLAVNLERGWMLLEQFPDSSLHTASVDRWFGAMRDYASIQRAVTGRTRDLIGSGLGDRRLSSLSAAVEDVLTDDLMMGNLNQPELESLHELQPTLRSAIAALAGYGLPETLVHGDLHPGNITVLERGYLYFDWSDACISHPFFDFETMIANRDSPEEPDFARRLRAGFVEPWIDIEPPSRLLEALELSRLPAILHQLASYRAILRVVEPAARWETATMARFWIGRMLEVARQSYRSGIRLCYRT